MQPKSIELIKAEHRGNLILQLKFDYDSALVERAKGLGCRWSQTKKCWYLPYQKDSYKKVIAHFKGTAWVDASGLFGGKPVAKIADKPIKKVSKNWNETPDYQLPPEIDKKLRARRYSENTRGIYISMLKLFFSYFAGKDVDVLTKEDIQEYILYLKEKRSYSSSSQNQAVNAIKFYYEKVKGQQRETYWIERPRKETKLPKVISEEEVVRMLQGIDNLKHLAIVSLLYSSGLRRSELLNLKKGDINVARKQILVEGGKGKKDRITILSETALEVLKKYVIEYKPTHFLFEGKPGNKYSSTSVAKIVQQAAEKAQIPMKVTPHILRHSFATHLMDQGIETRYIQILLGHESLNTTAIYAHVSTKSLNSISSPLDRLNNHNQLNINNLNKNDKKG